MPNFGFTVVDLPHTFRQRVRFDEYVYGFTGPSAGGQIRIQRFDTGQYWTGSAWTATQTWIATTMVPADKEHKYLFDPGTDLGGAYLAITMRLLDDPSAQETVNIRSQVPQDSESVPKVEIVGTRKPPS